MLFRVLAGLISLLVIVAAVDVYELASTNHHGRVELVTPPPSLVPVTADPTTNAVTLVGKSGLKVYQVKETDGSNTIFAVTANYTYDTALNSTDAPYGDKGFVVQRKGGDAALLKKNNATATSGQEATFQTLVGKRPGDADGSAGVSAGDNSKALQNP